VAPNVDSRAIFDRARRNRTHLFDGQRLRDAMEAAHVDALIATSGANVTYASGVWLPVILYPTFAVLTKAGPSTIVINEADAFFAREASFATSVVDYRVAPATIERSVDLVAGFVHETGLRPGSTVGIEPDHLSHATYLALTQRIAGINWIDGTDIFEKARLIKTPGEIEILRAAARSADQAIADGFTAAHSSTTEKGLAADIQSRALALGADSLLHAAVHSGPHSTVVHALSLEEPVREGEVIHVDFGASFVGYATDISRNAVVGRANERQRTIYQELWEIEQVAFQAIGPGRRSDEVFDAVRRAFESRHVVHPWRGIGHSIGLSIHEGFDIGPDSSVVLEPGMVVNVEPSHIEPGDARYHLEDTILVTADGHEILSDFSQTDRLVEIPY
jgi:Xaa-Pro dipeptidase